MKCHFEILLCFEERGVGCVYYITVFLFYQRGPRYFDPPDNSWGACFNCGEEGHAAVNCTAAKRRKPCYVCGGLGHNAKQCTKVCLTANLLFFIGYKGLKWIWIYFMLL